MLLDMTWWIQKNIAIKHDTWDAHIDHCFSSFSRLIHQQAANINHILFSMYRVRIEVRSLRGNSENQALEKTESSLELCSLTLKQNRENKDCKTWGLRGRWDRAVFPIKKGKIYSKLWGLNNTSSCSLRIWCHDVADITAPIKECLTPKYPFWLWSQQYSLSIWTKLRRQSFPMHGATAPPCVGSAYVQWACQRNSSVLCFSKPLSRLTGLGQQQQAQTIFTAWNLTLSPLHPKRKITGITALVVLGTFWDTKEEMISTFYS